MPDSSPSHSASVVPFEAETWPIVEHEPEREPIVPPDLSDVGEEMQPKSCPQCGEIDCMEDTHDG